MTQMIEDVLDPEEESSAVPEAETGGAGESIALTVAYDGAPFAGFARQDGVATVQGQLESALRTALRRPIATVGAGRTDAGVHALGQVVSFQALADASDDATLARSLNALACALGGQAEEQAKVLVAH